MAIGCALGACATVRAPAPDEQSSNVQHPDTRSTKRGVIVPSDVHLTGSEPPVPAMTQTASPGAPPPTGTGK
ncbi:MAG TPA: hypothetical protein VH853_14575 [Polyangia bacterium]|nr:hypothetical protein [Polyangia bacterium]